MATRRPPSACGMGAVMRGRAVSRAASMAARSCAVASGVGAAPSADGWRATRGVPSRGVQARYSSAGWRASEEEAKRSKPPSVTRSDASK